MIHSRRRSPAGVLIACVLSVFTAMSLGFTDLTGAAQAGDAPDRRIQGERIPGVGIQLTFGDQSCLVTRRGACRAWLRTIVGQLERQEVRLAFHGDFRGARLAGLNLAGVDFTGARLARADLRGADLRGADFTGVDLRKARLGFKSVDAPRLARTSKCQSITDPQTGHTQDIYCDQTKLTGASFYASDLRGVDFSHAAMQQVRMTDTLAQGAVFTMATLERSVITRTNFDGAIFDTTLLRSASIGDSSFIGANLYKALFYATEVSYSDFTQADLTKANFKGSLLLGNDFTGAIFSATTCPDYIKTDTGCAQER